MMTEAHQGVGAKEGKKGTGVMLPPASTTRLPTDDEPSDEGWKEAGLASRVDGNWREDPWNDGGERRTRRAGKLEGKGTVGRSRRDPGIEQRSSSEILSGEVCCY